MLFPPPPTSESFCSRYERCSACEVSSGKALRGSSAAKERSFWNGECFYTLRSNLPGFGITSVMKSHVNSGVGNILKFFTRKSPRGIQELVLKYQRWNLKRSFLLFWWVSHIESWARLVIFAFLFLLQNEAACASFLEKVKNYFVSSNIKGRELSFTLCGA